jgi:hypothetical protein
MGNLLAWVQNLFWKQEMELAIVGLQNAGKSTFVQVITVRGQRSIRELLDIGYFTMQCLSSHIWVWCCVDVPRQCFLPAAR